MKKVVCDVCEKLIVIDFFRIIMIPHNYLSVGSREFDVCSTKCLRDLYEVTAQALEESPDFSL